ncbi:MAG: universal stress protein [Desulfamplus sp.]|nr:universal stress protein [Desulfamplus sp.]
MRIQPKTIMCAVDFSNFTDSILSYSVKLCKEFQAKLFLIHVVIDVKTFFKYSDTIFDAEMMQAEQFQNAQKLLEDLTKDLTISHEVFVTQGDPADEISRFALEKKIDMVISATHGNSGIKRFLIGSVTEKLMKTLHCPLLVLHAQKHDFISLAETEIKLKRILVGCDFSSDSKLAFDYGVSLAQEFQAELYLAHVINPSELIELKASDYIDVNPGDYISWHSPNYFEMQRRFKEERRERVNELRSQLEKQLYFMLPEECRSWCNPKTVLLDGEPYKELINYAREQQIDMIVLGIHGHTLWEKLMVGSTTDRVIRNSPCPVLAVRQMNGDKG